MALLTGMTEDGREVPVQVDASGRLVAEGLQGPAGAQGQTGPKGEDGPAGKPSEFSSGTAALPGLSPVGDANTGIYSPGPDSLAISTGGVNRLTVDGSGNVGIGTSAPVAELHVVTHPATGSSTGSVVFGPNPDYGFEIRNYIDAGGFPRSELRGPTAGTGPITFCTQDKQRMAIGGNGDVWIGSTLPYEPKILLTGGGTIRAIGLPARVHADNAAATAAGLVEGDFYRKPDGTLMIAF